METAKLKLGKIGMNELKAIVLKIWNENWKWSRNGRTQLLHEHELAVVFEFADANSGVGVAVGAGAAAGRRVGLSGGRRTRPMADSHQFQFGAHLAADFQLTDAARRFAAHYWSTVIEFLV